MEEARRAKATDEHNVIDEAIAEREKKFTVFSIVRSRVLHISLSLTALIQPVGVIYRPPEKKMKNIKTKDYLGKAVRVIP